MIILLALPGVIGKLNNLKLVEDILLISSSYLLILLI
jgi:hypothetical protein